MDMPRLIDHICLSARLKIHTLICSVAILLDKIEQDILHIRERHSN